MSDEKENLIKKIIKYGYKCELSKSTGQNFDLYSSKLNEYVKKYNNYLLSGGGALNILSINESHIKTY